MSNVEGQHIHITGVVQGVGFRPFVYGLAQRFAMRGWVRNTSAGVDIKAEGSPAALAAFREALCAELPPLARVDSFEVTDCSPNGFTTFEIIHSEARPGEFQPVSPDVTVCEDCLGELFDPADRRYRYPFINCTNCGPRFTIIQDIPYDRPKTTMAPFEMCPDCAAEYRDPLDRRFHAQPVACPACGPHVWLEPTGAQANGQVPTSDASAAIEQARTLLAAGKVVAIKGLGGFHLACDATNPAAVAELRRRKLRVDKPFAVMVPDAETATRHCEISAAERLLLTSPERPIVVLQRRAGSTVAEQVAPGQQTIGVMLPYTPLHYLLLEQRVSEGEQFPEALVMTSGNLSEEPIAYRNEDARLHLSALADAFLFHDRDIHVRCDDSLVRVAHADPAGRDYLVPLRRSRGYAPFPVKLPWRSRPVLGAGAELKNTFCLSNGPYAFLSHHIGDLENYETLKSFEEGISHFERLFRVQPERIAYDLHPNYLATRYALERAVTDGIPAIGVQHHHAHIAACMAEHGLPQEARVIGLALDGTGYGTDGQIWGGEILLAGYREFERSYHLAYVPLAGGDRAVKEPWRAALAWLMHAGMSEVEAAEFLPAADDRSRQVVGRMIAAAQAGTAGTLNTPLTSSMGRLFDAIAALAGVRQTVNYEAQAAVELEARVDHSEGGAYYFHIGDGVFDAAPVIVRVVEDMQRRTPVPIIAARFHTGVAAAMVSLCEELRAAHDVHTVALSGGVWQNMTLLAETDRRLRAKGFSVLVHRQVPANDGGLALGQVAVALAGANS